MRMKERMRRRTQGDVECFEDVKEENETYAEAKWWTEGHTDLVDDNKNICKKLSADDIRVIKKSSVIPDLLRSYYKNTTDDNARKMIKASGWCFHGKGNYVAVGKYIYEVAHNLKNNPDMYLSEALSTVKFSPKGDNNIYTENKKGKKNKYVDVIDWGIKAAVEYANVKNIITEDKNKNKKGYMRQRADVVLGLIIHIAGDAYSHCAKVPKNSVSSATGDPRPKNWNKETYKKYRQNILYISDFDHWEKYKENGSDKLGVKEMIENGTFFQQLNRFMKKKVKDALKEANDDVRGTEIPMIPAYANNTNFYPERHDVGARNAVKYILKNYDSNKPSVGYKPYVEYLNIKGMEIKEECRILKLKEYAEVTYGKNRVGNACDNATFTE